MNSDVCDLSLYIYHVLVSFKKTILKCISKKTVVHSDESLACQYGIVSMEMNS